MSYFVLMWHLSYSGHLGSKLMMKFFLVILKLASWENLVFAVITNKIGVHVMFCLDVTFVMQWTHWLRIDNKVFLVILKTCIISKSWFSVITNEIGVMSCSILMWHLSYSGYIGFELMIKFFLWFLILTFWENLGF